jgi:hypothetical protein
MVDETSLNERTALKEWAVLVDAMARGEIMAMVRKGGIREQRAGFSVRHDRFLLYPTFFHEKAGELLPRFVPGLAESHARHPGAGTIRIECVAEVVGLWSVTDLDALRAIDGRHGMAWSAVESRFHYKGKPGVQVLAVRVSRLAAPVTMPEVRRYAGCVSWVELDADIDIAGATPALDDSSLLMNVNVLADALGPPLPTHGPSADRP